MFRDHSPYCPYPWHLPSRALVCPHPRLHGCARTLHFWSEDWGSCCSVDCLSRHTVGEAFQWGTVAKTGPLLRNSRALLPDTFPCATPVTHKKHIQELASRLAPWAHIHRVSWRACINCPPSPSNPVNFLCQRLTSWALHALRAQSPLVKGLGRASSRWPRRGQFVRQSLPWRHTLRP